MSPCRAEARAEDARSALTRGPSRSYPWWSPSIRPQPTHTCFRRARNPGGERHTSGVNELPSDALTTKFLALCQQHGSERLAVSIVAAGRSAGVPRLPQSNEWKAWNADEMRAAAEHLQRKLGR